MTVSQEKSANRFTQALFIYGSAAFLFYIFPPLSAPFRGAYKAAISAGTTAKSAADKVGQIADTLAPDLLKPVKGGDKFGNYQVGERVFFPCTKSDKSDCTIHPITKKIGAHRGIDVGAEEGKVQYTPGAYGKWKVTCLSEPGGAGNYAVIDYIPGSQKGKPDLNLRFRSFHLSRCGAGTYSPGQVFGATGSTGASTAPHYHWEQLERNDKGEWFFVPPQFAWLHQAITGDLPKPILQRNASNK